MRYGMRTVAVGVAFGFGGGEGIEALERSLTRG